jgi:chromate reductase, NAD(P)H dehydrogenase (quinone)
VRVVGIPGSLREGSFNRGRLRAAIELAPAGMEIQIFTRLGDIPPYNSDVDDKGNPEPVQALKAAIREADAMLIATPEYNYGVPGALKNAIDWASRPAGQSVLNRKPAAIAQDERHQFSATSFEKFQYAPRCHRPVLRLLLR